MTVEVTFQGGVELTMEVSDKYKVLSEMMYSDKRFTDRSYDNQYCDLVNQCIKEIYNNCRTNFSKFLKIPDTCVIAIIDKDTDEEMMVDDWD